MIAYDSFQTVQLAQEMKMIGIEAKYIPVEQDKRYLEFKHGLCEGNILVADNELLYRELRCLKHIGDHVDHSSVEAFGNGENQKQGVNSKDLADAVVRCYSAIRENLEKAIDVPLENAEFHGDYLVSLVTKMQMKREGQRLINGQGIYKTPKPDKLSLLQKLR